MYRGTLTNVTLQENGTAFGTLITEDEFAFEANRNPLYKGGSVRTNIVLNILHTSNGSVLQTLNPEL